MLYPMLALMFWTLCVALYLLTLRILAVRRGHASLGYFRLYTGDQTPPARAMAASRHYDNLFQMPTLYYLAGTTSLALDIAIAPLLAWAYVVFRVIHGVIHMTYNNVLHRLAAFMASNLVLIAIWVVVGETAAKAVK